MFSDKLNKSIAEAVKKVMDEELKGQQHKLDVNKNNKVDAEDFKHLRAGKKPVAEAMSKADTPTYMRKKMGDKPLTMADVKGPRKDSISSKEGLAKLRNEEQEQIDELSKDTLKSYMGKAKTELGIHARNVGNPGASAKDQEVANASAAKRTAGATRAGQKLKEEEQLDEYTSTGGRYVHTAKAAKDANAGTTDWDQEEKMAKNLTSKTKEKKPRKLGARQNFVRSKRVNEGFSAMLEAYNEGGIKGLFQSMIKEEPTNDEFKKELDKQQAKSEGKAPQAEVAKAAVQAVKVEQVEESFTMGEKMPNKQGGHNQDVHYNGKKIGHIESYSHRTGTRYGMEHQASGEGTAGSRSHEEALADLKAAHKEHMKEEVEQLDELSPGTLKSYVNKAKPEVKAAKAERHSAEMADDYKTASDSQVTIGKRTAGIKQAKAKLNAEETEIEVLDYNDINGVKEASFDLEEKTLTTAETDKKEEVVKSMKKGIQGFKDRYGSDAKSVMYATATKMAKDKA